jgi:hypothetical protein
MNNDDCFICKTINTIRKCDGLNVCVKCGSIVKDNFKLEDEKSTDDILLLKNYYDIEESESFIFKTQIGCENFQDDWHPGIKNNK